MLHIKALMSENRYPSYSPPLYGTLRVMAFFLLGLFIVTVLTPLVSVTNISSPDEVTTGLDVGGACSVAPPTSELTKSQYPLTASSYTCVRVSYRYCSHYTNVRTLFMSPSLFQLSHLARPTKSIIPGRLVVHLPTVAWKKR